MARSCSEFEVLEKAQITSIETMLMKNQLRWLGHCSKMNDSRLPKIILYGELKMEKEKLVDQTKIQRQCKKEPTVMQHQP